MREINFDALVVKERIEVINDTKVQILYFVGQIDQNNSYTISDNINAFFESGTFNTILDLSNLVYVNSIGLAAILAIIKKTQEHSAKLSIGGINPKIHIIIQLLDLTNQVEVFSSVEKALEAW
ncbi:MAG TPA: STAS domain-containing protein [Leptospiraceae bacterium]|nr:STAS domain-containing protein [Leptospiraceae bacterium]HMW04722.1 STAS domain-containing protein [Leptospiraceae bacterium]HMX31753.1 STAS domain-containing protein [Leptospiraceae bacterium]HMY30559.1 STAS domain-containing protein [Leptospiraceae bacterium]HMZ64140.1 STAS domain-containing protein [Leptospiraceae bacterium]